VKDVPVSKIALNSKSIALFPTEIPVIVMAYVGLENNKLSQMGQIIRSRQKCTRRKNTIPNCKPGK
jgi:hypothetical protein